MGIKLLDPATLKRNFYLFDFLFSEMFYYNLIQSKFP